MAAEDQKSIEDIGLMYNEARDIILSFGYEGVALDILVHCPELAHTEFTSGGQSKISKEIAEHKTVKTLHSETARSDL
jgi:hypothetical protein